MLEIKKATLILGQKIHRKDKTLFDCEVKIALLNSSGKVTKLPNDMVNKMKLFFESQLINLGFHCQFDYSLLKDDKPSRTSD